MKLNGVKICGKYTHEIFILRDNPIIFKAQSIDNYDEFDKLYPQPKPKYIHDAKAGQIADKDDPVYQESVKIYAETKIGWLVYWSLSATPNLEWETINENDISSYRNWDKELKEAGLNNAEISRVLKGVMLANSLDEEKIEEAKKDFLRSQAPKT